MDEPEHSLLAGIEFPDDLRRLKETDLPRLCDELREFIIDVVCSNPGHFGASLGVVELTVALHYVFNTPEDQIIWDVGHQAYGHKILTGRKKVFHTNRKYGGISGFPKPSESEYDAFGVGHSSTSISAALGMAVANQRYYNNPRQVVAVIGDGAMNAGLAFEGLNNAGDLKPDMLVILNDNNIAIDANVGALKEYLVDITTSPTYNRFKDEIWNMLGKLSKIAPHTRELASKLEAGLKTTLLRHSNLFESLNFRYFGPVDGHDVIHLTQILRDLKKIKGPKLLHILTKKGKGYRFAEENQTAFHAPGIFDKKTGKIFHVSSGKNLPPRYQDVFGLTLIELAEMNSRVVGITPAMPTGCSLNLMMKKYPRRAFDVGICEQHAVTFSAGLATQGMIPFCNIYSTFIQRAYDQVIHDVALQKLPVVFCLDRGGLVGDDGATHHGAFDLAFMRIIPGMTVSAPMDEVELRNLMYTAQLGKYGTFSIRYPRGNGVIPDWKQAFSEIKPGTGRLIREGTDVAVLSIGHTGNMVAEASRQLEKDNIQVLHYDMRFVKPLDTRILDMVARKFNEVITVEDGCIQGGFGSAVMEYYNDKGLAVQVMRLGIPDRFIEHGTQKELQRECGFDTDSIASAARTLAKKKLLSNAG